MLTSDRRKLAMSTLALNRAAHDWPRLLVVIRSNIEKIRRTGFCSDEYLQRIEQLLDQGPEVFRDTILAETDEGQVLRSIGPWSDWVRESERMDIILSIR